MTTKSDSTLPQWLWTMTIFVTIILLLITLSLVIQTDDSNEAAVHIYLDSNHPIHVLHQEPEEDSEISFLLEGGTRVEVISFNETRNPNWVEIRHFSETGWVGVDQVTDQLP